jgi:hypothetical protein
LPCLVWLAFAALSIAWSDYRSSRFALFAATLYPFILFLISFMLVRSRRAGSR